MNGLTNAFKAMIVRELLLEPGLAKEFEAARVFSWVGKKMASPLAMLVEASTRVRATAVELAVRAITGERFMTLPLRSVSDILAAFKSADDNYHSCCRSALCYAVTGSRDWAFGALRVAASKHDDWARHHHLYGLIHGVSGDYQRALMELERATAAEPIEDVRGRIGEAVELCWLALEVPAEKASDAVMLSRTIPRLPEAVRVLLELIEEVKEEG